VESSEKYSKKEGNEKMGGRQDAPGDSFSMKEKKGFFRGGRHKRDQSGNLHVGGGKRVEKKSQELKYVPADTKRHKETGRVGSRKTRVTSRRTKLK